MKRLSRRALLGGGAALAGLPWLEYFDRRAFASPKPGMTSAAHPKRFVVLYTPNGTDMNAWATGETNSWEPLDILKPLAAHKERLTVVRGLQQLGKDAPAAHENGTSCFLTGNACKKGAWPLGPSADQRIAEVIGKETRLRSLELGVKIDRDDIEGRISYASSQNPLPPINSPHAAFDRVFAGITPMTGTGGMEPPAGPSEAELRAERRKRVLGRTLERLAGLEKRLGQEDRIRLEAHTSAVTDLAGRLDVATTNATPECNPPTLANLPGEGTNFAKADDNAVAAITRAHMDIMGMSLACDVTRVITLQLGRGFGHIKHRHVGVNESHHEISHETKDHEPEAKRKAAFATLKKIDTWHAEQLGYLVDQLIAMPEGDGSVMDNTVILWGNELSHGGQHSRKDMHYLLIGNAGGEFEMNRYLRADTSRYNNDLLTSLINVMGIPDQKFGREEWSRGPLPDFA